MVDTKVAPVNTITESKPAETVQATPVAAQASATTQASAIPQPATVQPQPAKLEG